MSTPDLRATAEAHLRALAGEHAVLRDDQWAAIESLVVARRPTLVVQRTGWGKSAVYFVATALLRARGSGPTVIVSPLLALMRNQIAAAERAGIRARTVNSTNLDAWQAVYAEVAAGAVDVLLVSPERLNNPDFRDQVLPALAGTAGLVVIDEAHCISDWGHDFRPDYRRIRTLLAGLPPATPVLATTATANARVTADIAEQLGAGDTAVFRGNLDRESLALSVLQLPSPAHRQAWLAEHLGELPGSGIVYTLTVAETVAVTEMLTERGYRVAAYSGQTDDAERLQAEDDLLANRVKALVATSALGMGFDKPDLGFVVHLGAPQSPIAYYQQVGRAGRATESAQVVLLPAEEDEQIWRYFAGLAFPAEEQVRRTLAALTEAGRPVSTASLEAQVDLRRNRLEMMLKVLDVDGAVRRMRGGWTATGQPWSYDAERYRRVAEARSVEQQAMRAYLATDGCRLEFLRRQLDDPAASACGRCDNCTGVPTSGAVAETSLQQARADLERVGVPIEPRRLWPTGMAAVGVALAGKIAADRQAEPGRALTRLSDVGWGTRLRPLLGPGAPDGPVPPEVLAGVVRLLAGWGWQRRPVAIVCVPSRARPQLVASLARGIGEIGRLPVIGTLDRRAGTAPGGGRSNSAQRLRELADAFEVPAELAQALAATAGEPVLLV
ncbi:MAG: RecQ family ATP-dependent DNA helicase, partial [Actinomycetota bacterium]|nr:RecQ family ATP-dependent DNA helicase [Actinomycetota bacterium]